MYEAVLFLGRNIMHQCIEEADRTLAQQRDRGMYQDKGYRPTTLKTVMGEVEYQWHVYLLSGPAERPRATVYLLDKSMGLDTVGLFSDTVCMMVVEAACGVSYRTAATTLNGLTGLHLPARPIPPEQSCSHLFERSGTAKNRSGAAPCM